jgi:hypothetical protein
VSGDGGLVYLVGTTGYSIGPSGATVDDPSRAGSLTVIDAATGAVRAVAGQLGGEYLQLDAELVP